MAEPSSPELSYVSGLGRGRERSEELSVRGKFSEQASNFLRSNRVPIFELKGDSIHDLVKKTGKGNKLVIPSFEEDPHLWDEDRQWDRRRGTPTQVAVVAPVRLILKESEINDMALYEAIKSRNTEQFLMHRFPENDPLTGSKINIREISEGLSIDYQPDIRDVVAVAAQGCFDLPSRMPVNSGNARLIVADVKNGRYTRMLQTFYQQNQIEKEKEELRVKGKEAIVKNDFPWSMSEGDNFREGIAVFIYPSPSRGF